MSTTSPEEWKHLPVRLATFKDMALDDKKDTPKFIISDDTLHGKDLPSSFLHNIIVDDNSSVIIAGQCAKMIPPKLRLLPNLLFMSLRHKEPHDYYHAFFRERIQRKDFLDILNRALQTRALFLITWFRTPDKFSFHVYRFECPKLLPKQNLPSKLPGGSW